MQEPPRPSYDPNILAVKRRETKAALEAAFKALLCFGTCKVVKASDAAMDAARQYQQNVKHQ